MSHESGDATLSFALDPSRHTDDGTAELPSATDSEIRDLLLHVADDAGIDRIKSVVPSGADEVLAAFAESAASIAVRHRDSREVRAGLLAAVIALDLTTDQRDVVPVLALLYRATEMIGDDPALTFLTVTELCGGRTRPPARVSGAVAG